eukprot:COSAG05_NODE_8401_length_707_cov_0.722039_2_plen_113_part_01
MESIIALDPAAAAEMAEKAAKAQADEWRRSLGLDSDATDAQCAAVAAQRAAEESHAAHVEHEVAVERERRRAQVAGYDREVYEAEVMEVAERLTWLEANEDQDNREMSAVKNC